MASPAIALPNSSSETLACVRLGLADGVDHVAQEHGIADELLDERPLDDLHEVDAREPAHALERGDVDVHRPGRPALSLNCRIRASVNAVPTAVPTAVEHLLPDSNPGSAADP
jgi:hypothetical protein